jgi:hypothetical protein
MEDPNSGPLLYTISEIVQYIERLRDGDIEMRNLRYMIISLKEKIEQLEDTSLNKYCDRLLEDNLQLRQQIAELKNERIK